MIGEANALLDSGTVEEMRAWLETGYPLAQAEDDRIAIARLLADPDISDALRAAAGTALDDNTPEALRHFLEVGRYEVGQWPVRRIMSRARGILRRLPVREPWASPSAVMPVSRFLLQDCR
ncbi:ALF repeat-containing protein [Streptomyces sp. NPDC057052]|uniref:ALF repeat-containing protein n=1 Tax=Streptomyces sp. NPDC057052 TaxID=3346010 RepID=UPI00362D3A18